MLGHVTLFSKLADLRSAQVTPHQHHTHKQVKEKSLLLSQVFCSLTSLILTTICGKSWYPTLLVRSWAQSFGHFARVPQQVRVGDKSQPMPSPCMHCWDSLLPCAGPACPDLPLTLLTTWGKLLMCSGPQSASV